MSLEQSREKTTVAPTYVDDCRELRKIVALDDGLINDVTKARHRLIEEFSMFTILGSVRPCIHAKDFVKSHFSRFHTVKHGLPCRIMIGSQLHYSEFS